MNMPTKIFIPRESTALSLGANDIAQKTSTFIETNQLDVRLLETV